LQLDGYLECLQRCRDRFPALSILSGVELGERHWHSADAGPHLSAGQFDRVPGSLRCPPAEDQRISEMPWLHEQLPAAGVMRR
jgi:histidinol-phosphatase (PHP family)